MRLLICDDNKLLLNALTMALIDNGHTVVATALDPGKAVAAAREHQPDVCLLDVSFPHGTGLSAIDRIQEVSPGTKVVILSGSISRGLMADAIAQDAQDAKDEQEAIAQDGEDGQDAPGLGGEDTPVRATRGAPEMADQRPPAVGPLVLDLLRTHAQEDGALRVLRFLTDREWDVLRCIMHGLSTDDMAEQLGVHVSTARTHVQNLLGKFGVHSRLQVAALVTAHASKESWSRLGIVSVPAAADDDRVAEAVHMGVRDWVVKESAMEALLAAVREAAGGEAHLSAALLTRDLASLSDQRPVFTHESEVVALLTTRELDVLRCLSEGLSGNQIGALLHVSPNTVRTHRRSILHKLNVHSTLTAVALARSAGIDGLRDVEMIDPWEGFAARQNAPEPGPRDMTGE